MRKDSLEMVILSGMKARATVETTHSLSSELEYMNVRTKALLRDRKDGKLWRSMTNNVMKGKGTKWKKIPFCLIT